MEIRVQKGKSVKYYAEGGRGSDLRLRSRRESLRSQGQRKDLEEAARGEVGLHNKFSVQTNLKLRCRINSICLGEK